MWVHQTIFSLTQALAQNPEISEIIFFGICGHLSSTENIVQVANVHHTSHTKEFILPVHTQYAPLVTMLTSDTPVHAVEKMQVWNMKYTYVDMESRWVAFVADKVWIPCSILRVPYDEISTIDCETFNKNDAFNVMTKALENSSLDNQWKYSI